MKGFINKNQINYLFFHLNHSIDIHEKIIERLVFLKDSAEIKNYNNKIIFLLSENGLDYQKIKWIDDIPVLFPLSTDSSFFSISNNLIFTDDILKSSFYLLSGYQEYNSNEKDKYGRFLYEKSIQKRLDIIDRPIVNYYFKEIASGIREFCIKENIRFSQKKLVDNFGFLLTHDIDRVDAFNYYTVGYKFKQLIGLAKPEYSKLTSLKVFVESAFHLLNVFNRRNPFWNFNFLRKIENDNNIRSVFFFLKNEGKLDSKYSLQEKRIIKIIEKLLSEGCEIGLHGTMNSARNFESMIVALNELTNISKTDIVGCRQHFLQFHHPQTMIIQERCNIKYDTTLCFAEHEGFRNSYCLPFKIYHFEEDRMIHVWEFPLNVMEVTLFGYRNLSFEEAKTSISNLITETIKFSGLFTLLWHNCFFDENKYRGITVFYEKLLKTIKDKNPQNITGKEFLKILNEKNNQYVDVC